MTIKDLALVGAGYWGKNLARNFLALNSLHTLCDANEETLASYGKEYADVARERSFETVLTDPVISKVALATPAVTHFRLAKMALEAGKDVYVEKPLCLDVREAQRLIDIAQSCGRILMVGHLLQYHAYVEKLTTMVHAGELGRLHYITSNRLNLGKIRQEENSLWSFAPHDISVILGLAGAMPENVVCHGGSYLTDGVADTTLTQLQFAGGLRAHVYVSWLNPFKEQKLTVVGSEGMAVFDDTKPWEDKLVVYRDYLSWTEGNFPSVQKSDGKAVIVDQTEPLKSECQHFLDCCENKTTPRTDGAEGMRVLQVLNAAQQSLENEGQALSPTNQNAARFFAHPTAIVDSKATIGLGTKIWHFAHVFGGAVIGEDCSFGQNTMVADEVVIGRNVKVQNNVAIYAGTKIEDDVFLGPSCVLTNVSNPRSQVVRRNLYEKTLLKRGATVGANSTIVCGVSLGNYCFIAAGAVVTKNVPDYALVAGVPAKQIGWMSRHGHTLDFNKDLLAKCPESGLQYQLTESEKAGSAVHCLDLEEESPLPEKMAIGKHSYRDIQASKLS